MSAIPYLQRQLRQLTINPPAGFRIEQGQNIYNWTVWFSGPDNTPYAGGQYKAMLDFPNNFPMQPPKFRIVSKFWHPNVYSSGKVCISILDPPCADDLSVDNTVSMRWTPVQTVRSVLVSIISLLSDPDPKDAGAPANVDALVQWRNHRQQFNQKCEQLALKSLQELPQNFVPPQRQEKIEKPVIQSLIPTCTFTTNDNNNVNNHNDNVNHHQRVGNVNGQHEKDNGFHNDNNCTTLDDQSSDNEGNDAFVVNNEAKKQNDKEHKRNRTKDEKGTSNATKNNTHRYMDVLAQFHGLGFPTTKTDQQLLAILDQCRGELASLIQRVV